MNVVEAEVRGVLKRDGYAEIVGEIFEAEERKGEFSQPKKNKKQKTKTIPCLLYTRTLQPYTCVLFYMT